MMDVTGTATKKDAHGNAVAREGCDRCSCGCKYWENDRCIDCGTPISEVTRQCPECDHDLMPPGPAGQPGDDSYYCEGCGRAWSLDLQRVKP